MTRLRLQSSCGIAGGDLKSAGAPLSSCAYKVRAYRSRLLGLSARRHQHRGSGRPTGPVGSNHPCAHSTLCHVAAEPSLHRRHQR